MLTNDSIQCSLITQNNSGMCWAGTYVCRYNAYLCIEAVTVFSSFDFDVALHYVNGGEVTFDCGGLSVLLS